MRALEWLTQSPGCDRFRGVTMTARDDQVRVRRLIPPDAGRWRVLWDAYTAFYREDIPEGVTSLTFQRLCDGAQGMVGLVAVGGDDEPVGLAHLVFHSSTWSAIDSGYLEDLYVDPAHRGGRLARSLYDTVGTLTSFVVYEHLGG